MRRDRVSEEAALLDPALGPWGFVGLAAAIVAIALTLTGLLAGLATVIW
jgi:hypothetical protein